MKKSKTHFFFRILIALLFLVPVLSFAQAKTITGTVTDSDGMPLPGATVVVKGTNRGTQTDFDGKFSIDAASNEVLIISYIGMKAKEITVGNQTTITTSLEEDSAQLDEVVVVGYGQTKRSEVTTSIVSVGEEEIKSRPVNNALEAIQGKAAGVDITTSQRPGTLGSITVRGVRSLTAANDPLYVVDGIPLISGGIENINPNDIESIDVLKDASATAIYGSRGANGVVIVTTKSGKTGRFTVSLNYATTIEELHEKAPMMTASEYITFRRWAKHYSNPSVFPKGDEPTQANDYDIFLGSGDPSAWANILKGWEGGTWDGSKVTDTDWTKFVTQTGVTNQYSIGVSGGTEKMKAFGSFGYLDNKGTVVGQQYKRYTGKLTIDIAPIKWFNFGGTLNASYGVINFGQSQSGRNGLTGNDGLYESAKSVFRYAVPYDDQGNRVELPGGDVAVKTIINEVNYTEDERINLRMFGSFYSQVDIGEIIPVLKGLKYRVNFGPDLSIDRNGFYADAKSVVRSGSNYASLNHSQSLSYTLDHLLLYNRSYGDHSINLTLGQTETKFRNEFSYKAADNIPDPQNLWNALSTENLALTDWETGLIQRQILSYLGRLAYNYKDTYFLTASGRYDGASQLAEGNQWAFFPTLSLGWTLTNEQFFKAPEWVDQIKLRAGVGTVGNSAIDPYSTKGGLVPLFYPSGGTMVPGTRTSDILANQDLTWEKTTQYNYAIDFSFFNYRISGSLDYYTSKTSDLLLEKSLPSVTGYPTTLANVGKTKSSGLELTLNTTNIMTDDFKWNTTISASTQTSEIVELSNGAEDDINNNWFIGEQLGVIYGYENDGLWQESDAAEMALFNANGHVFAPGLTKPVDQNGDHIIDANNDRVVIGNTLPKYILGFTNTFNYKNVELSVFMVGRFDYIYNTGGENQPGRYNQRSIDYWTDNNTGAYYQKPIYTAGTADPYFSSLGYMDGSFLKIRTISLGYNFPAKITDKLGINNLKIYVQALNPGTIYSKIDFIDLDVRNSYFNRGFTTGVNLDF